MGDQLLGQPLDVHRLLAQGGQLGQGRRGVPGRQGVRHTEQVAAVGDAGHLPDHRLVDLAGDAGAGVQDGQRVPQSAVGQPGDQPRRPLGEGEALSPGHLGHPPGDVLRADAGEVVPLAAGTDGGRHLLDLGGGQDENDVGRRLLQGLQQGVEGRRGEHMHLVDDVHFVAAGAGGVGSLVPQVADVVHAVVGGGVHLHHVQNAAVVDAAADRALAAGVAVLRVQAVDRFGEDLGAGGLAGAAHAGEQIGVAHPAGGDLVFQGRHDGPLAHHILEPLGPPLAVKGTIHGPSLLPAEKHKNTDSAAGLSPALRSSAYECRLAETHRARRLRLLGSPPDLVHSGPVVQGPHPYAEPRSRRCPTWQASQQSCMLSVFYHILPRNARGRQVQQ